MDQTDRDMTVFLGFLFAILISTGFVAHTLGMVSLAWCSGCLYLTAERLVRNSKW